MNDLRYALRIIGRNPGLSLSIVLLLSIGIGTTAVMFGAFDKVMLRPLAVRAPEQLVRMVQDTPRVGRRSSFPYRVYEELRKQATSFVDVCAELQVSVAMTQPEPATVIQVRLESPEFFETLAVRALYGRYLTSDDVRQSGDIPAVLSFGFWRTRFDADPAAIGRKLILNGHSIVIVGIMPESFNGIAVDTTPDVRVPLEAYTSLQPPEEQPLEKHAYFEIAGRLNPGVTRAAAEAEARQIWRRAETTYWTENGNSSPDFIEQQLKDELELDSLERGVSVLRDRFGQALRLLLIGAGLLLALVCVNIAALLIAREASRQQETAVRLAVGATRGRLVKQTLIENTLLAFGGMAAGLTMAMVCGPLLVRALPPMRDFTTVPLTAAIDLRPDWRIFAFSLVLSLSTMFVAGLLPALGATRLDLDRLLRGARSAGRLHGRTLMVVFQIAFCTMLAAGAGLFVRTLTQLGEVHAGFDPNNIITFTINPGIAGYSADRSSTFRRDLVQQVQALPGVEKVATGGIAIMRGSGLKTSVGLAGHAIDNADFLSTSLNDVSEEYFKTLRIGLIAGRELTATDRTPQPAIPVVVNQTFAQHFFPPGSEIGQFFGIGRPGAIARPDYQIVGISNDAKYRSLREPMVPTIYRLQAGGDFFQLVVRTTARPETVIQPVRQVIARLDASVPVSEIHTMPEEIENSIAAERLTALLATFYGFVAATLSAIAIYGLLTFVVVQRSKEIGIRTALGARQSDITKMIGARTLWMIGVGLVSGFAVLLLARSLFTPLLYGVTASDPKAFGFAVVVVIVPAIIATLIPVSRASRVPAAVVLKQDRV